MDIEKIEILLRAIELGSLSKAADEFLYTPSALSHLVKGIEDEIGTKFLKRTYAGIEVEKGHEEIISNLKKIVEIENQTKQIANKLNKRKNGLTIATYASLSKYILSKIIKGFNEKHPDINITILVVEDVKKAYKEGKADILLGENIEEKNMSWEEILVDPFVAIVPKTYKISCDTIKREDLYKYNFIKATDSNISSYIDETKFPDIFYVDSQDDSSVLHMVKEGLGIAILPKLSVSDNKSVDCLTLEPKISRMLGLTYKDKKEVHLFLNYIRENKKPLMLFWWCSRRNAPKRMQPYAKLMLRLKKNEISRYARYEIIYYVNYEIFCFAESEIKFAFRFVWTINFNVAKGF